MAGKLQIPADLEREEVELNVEDLEPLGVEEGISGYLEILSRGNDEDDDSSAPMETSNM